MQRDAGGLAPTLTELLLAAGPADRALQALASVPLPPAGRELADRLAAAVAAVRARAPTLRLTIDPVEFRGFRYETGISVTIYAPDRHEELGRGGRYVCGEAEPATGLTVFPDAVLRAVPPRAARQRLYVPLVRTRTRLRVCGVWATPRSPVSARNAIRSRRRDDWSARISFATALPCQ